MKDVRDGGNVDESRFPSYTQWRRPRRWLRALAGTYLAVTMVGGSTMVAGGIAPAASAHVLAPNEACYMLSAAAGQKYCLKADAGDSQVQLTWSPSAPVGTVIVYYTPPQGIGRPAAVTKVTDENQHAMSMITMKDGKEHTDFEITYTRVK